MKNSAPFMRNATLLLMTLVAVLLVTPPAGATTLRIVGLPRSADAHQIETAIAGWALNLAPGDTMMLYDARGRTLVGTIAIPNDPTKARPERKVDFIVPGMTALKKYFANAPVPGVDGAVIDASSFLDEIAPLIKDHSSEDVRVALIGSPWFTAPGALEGKDYQGSFPSDGLILGDRSRSPIGTQGRRDLNGVSVDYCITTGPTTFLTPEQQERVERAWGLIIVQRGGQLTTFTTDLKSCFDRFAESKAPDGKPVSIDQTDAQVLAMYKAKDVAPKIMDAPPIKTAEPAPPPANTRQEEAARFDRPARTVPPSTLTGIAWIGIQWREPIDLDLYVRCSANAPFLFFANQLSSEGRHNFDYRVGTGNAFETVDLTQPCADISKAQVFVNFYSGRVSAPITGVLAIQFDGGIYKSNFTMPASYGNGGRGLSSSADMGAPFWVRIDLPTALRLQASGQRRANR